MLAELLEAGQRTGGFASERQLQSASREAAVLRGTISWQGEASLTIRRLLVSVNGGSGSRARGGGGARERRAGGCSFDGCVFGVVLSSAVAYARFGGHFRAAEVLAQLRDCLGPAAADLASCSGEDANLLALGMASRRVVRKQLLRLEESRSSGRASCAYGRGGVALGASACMHFLISATAKNAGKAGSLEVACDRWTSACARALDGWRWLDAEAEEAQERALRAEQRALRRGVLGLRAAKREAQRLGISPMDAARMYCVFMRRAMWPAGRRLDAEAQEGLCAWIESAGFVQDAAMPPPRGAWYTPNMPLSQIPLLPREGQGESDWDSASSLGTPSSASSGDSVGSAGSLGSEQIFLERLASFFG
jgi:hypothetical protein